MILYYTVHSVHSIIKYHMMNIWGWGLSAFANMCRPTAYLYCIGYNIKYGKKRKGKKK
jgi:hypothetical protein